MAVLRPGLILTGIGMRSRRMTPCILSLCDRTGIMVLPWLEAGYRAVTVDLQDEANPHPLRRHIRADVRGRLILPSEAAIVFAFPPCTNLAVSGARWFRDKGLSGLIEALAIVEACRDTCEAYSAPYMIENPVSTLSTYWRNPDHTFHPSDYTGFHLGDHYTKKTCLWTGGGFIMPEPRRAPELADTSADDRIHKAPPSAERADFRSATPIGFARAVFAANHAILAARAA
jgi:hypothetical protein